MRLDEERRAGLGGIGDPALLFTCCPAAAAICTVDAVPAATLLLPYFEVDLANPSGTQTLFSINNASATAVLVHVVIWSGSRRCRGARFQSLSHRLRRADDQPARTSSSTATCRRPRRPVRIRPTPSVPQGTALPGHQLRQLQRRPAPAAAAGDLHRPSPDLAHRPALDPLGRQLRRPVLRRQHRARLHHRRYGEPMLGVLPRRPRLLRLRRHRRGDESERSLGRLGAHDRSTSAESGTLVHIEASAVNPSTTSTRRGDIASTAVMTPGRRWTIASRWRPTLRCATSLRRQAAAGSRPRWRSWRDSKVPQGRLHLPGDGGGAAGSVSAGPGRDRDLQRAGAGG